VLLIVGAIAVFILLTSIRGIAGFYTDYLWFDSLGHWAVRRTMLGAQFSLAFIFITAFFLLAWTNLYVAERLAPPFRPSGPEDELLERYHELVAGRMGRVRVIASGILALIAGSGASSEWESWLLFTNGGDFGITDPQFNRDVGFYVFRLPFLSFVIDWLFASLLIVLIVTAVAHYLNGGIRVQPPSPRVTPQVKAHLSVLLAVLALVKTADYFLQRFELTGSTRGVVDGASYTDVNAQLPALNLLVLISVAAAALFVANIFRRGWALPVVAVALWGFVALALGGIYPEAVQFFSVKPNESAKEERFIERNISATREAMGLTDIDVRRYVPVSEPDQVDLSAHEDTIRNIRLWDPSQNLSGKSFEQLQRIRDYYQVSDLDVDRYMIDGEPTQTALGVRTINPDRVPGGSWENRHLAYTHGYGAILAPSNASAGRQPDFLVRDVPVDSPGGDLTVEQPGIYFGEDLGGYAIVDTERDEIDFQDENGTQLTDYDGEDGVNIGSMMRRAAFALRFGNLNPLISDFISGESRIMFIRDVTDRVRTLAPFLEADADPYPVILNGDVVWVMDLYTTTSRYPYAQRADTDQVSEGSGLRNRFNYVRNSVKATVDAYDGTVNFYVMPGDDPIIDAYRKAFPDLFSDFEDMPDGLEEHLRYPEDLFRVQTAAWERYHLGEPGEFYQQDNGWRIARDPGTAGAAPATPVTNEQGEPTGQVTATPIAPYYQLLQLPGEESAEFVMMRPFVPFSEDDRSQLLTAFMAARMDPGHYGELVVYTMPEGRFPPGPGIAQASISANDDVGEAQTLLGQTGSRVRLGNLLLVPLGDTLLYVQPFYVEAESEARQIPLLERVIAVLPGGRSENGQDQEDQVVIAETLEDALVELFGERVETQEDPGAAEPGQPEPEPGEEEPDGAEPSEPTGTAEEQAEVLLGEMRELLDQADQALAEGDLGTYQDRIDEAGDKLDEALELLGVQVAEGDGSEGSGAAGEGNGGGGGGAEGGGAAGGEAENEESSQGVSTAPEPQPEPRRGPEQQTTTATTTAQA
jgi:uncharacterized membrane protein (UPF0182 family)